MFPPNPQKVIWLSPKLSNFKKEKLLLDKVQQLSSNSWASTVAGITGGPRESRNRWAWNKKKWTNGCGKFLAWGCLRQILSGIRISDDKDNWPDLSGASFSWANTTGRRMRIKRLKGCVSMKESTRIYFTHSDTWSPAKRSGPLKSEGIRFGVYRSDPLGQMVLSDWVKDCEI